MATFLIAIGGAASYAAGQQDNYLAAGVLFVIGFGLILIGENTK